MNNPMQVQAQAHSGHSSNPKSMIDVRSSMTPLECRSMVAPLALPARPQQAKNLTTGHVGSVWRRKPPSAQLRGFLMSDPNTALASKVRETANVVAVSPERPLPEPSARESTAIAKATANVQARAPRLAAKVVRKDSGQTHSGPNYSDINGWSARLLDAFGTSSVDFVQAELGRMAMAVGATGSDAEQKINAALAVLDGIRPRDEVEAMLVAQMVVTHAVAMDYLTRTQKAELIQAAEFTSNFACKLLRAFAAQTEALGKLRRGGEQVVKVEHVHVHAGGQAVVGAVTGIGGLKKSDEQARALISAGDPPSPALRGPDKEREALPLAGDPQETMQNAWRRGGLRSTAGGS